MVGAEDGRRPAKSCGTPDGKHQWEELGDCDHTVEEARFGTAVQCSVCGTLAHRWKGFSCMRQRMSRDTRAKLIAVERDRCPAWKLWRAAQPEEGAEK